MTKYTTKNLIWQHPVTCPVTSHDHGYYCLNCTSDEIGPFVGVSKHSLAINTSVYSITPNNDNI